MVMVVDIEFVYSKTKAWGILLNIIENYPVFCQNEWWMRIYLLIYRSDFRQFVLSPLEDI